MAGPEVIAAVASVVTAAGSVMQASKGAPKTPEPKTPPTVDDEQTRRAKEREMMRRYAATGRAGTILTGPGSATKLG